MPDKGPSPRDQSSSPSFAGADASPHRGPVETEAELSARQALENPDSVLPGAAPAPRETQVSNRPPDLIRQYELVELVRAYDPQVDEDLLNRAYIFALKAHGDQKRSSGDPYFSHPLAVARILTEMKLDPPTIATALLHDVVEDTEVSIDEIESVFGAEIARLVDGVTKISKRELAPDTDGKAENFSKFLLATAKDVRVLLVKLADRLHNMRTLHHISKPEKRERISLETMEIYAPLAGRIGVQQIKEELEDLSFRYLNANAYQGITEGLEKLGHQAVKDVVALAQTLRAELHKAGIQAEVYSREKRAFSIWRKMQRKRTTFDELADIYAFRVIVGNTADCYRALGVIHENFPMIPGEFDDYISTPKPNGYQSIHTAVLATQMDRQGQRVEIQIRSKAMHQIAELGVAAHWRYKDASARTKDGDTIEIGGGGDYSPYDWLRRIIESLSKGDGISDFLHQAKIDLYQDQVFPFTPKGRVIPLPRGATALDFAYSLHTEVGDQYSGAIINGVQRPNRTRLRNGDVVEILKSRDAPIPRGWDTYVMTSAAKSGIKRKIKALKRQEQKTLGQRIISSTFGARDLPFSFKAMQEAAEKLALEDADELYEAVGRMDISGQKVLRVVYPDLDAEKSEHSDRAIPQGAKVPRGAVSINGVQSGAAIRLGSCCGPLPGERIVGVRDGEGGIIAHRIDCDELIEADDEEWLNLSWEEGKSAHYVVPIVVTVNNKTGALGHIGSMLARYDADIVDLKLDHREVEFSDLLFDIAVKDARHLINVLTGLRASDYVVSADRRDEEDDNDEHG